MEGILEQDYLSPAVFLQWTNLAQTSPLVSPRLFLKQLCKKRFLLINQAQIGEILHRILVSAGSLCREYVNEEQLPLLGSAKE
jgi:hypothetical protein